MEKPSKEAIERAIAKYNLKPTSQFTAEELAIKCIMYQGKMTAATDPYRCQPRSRKAPSLSASRNFGARKWH